MYIKSNEVITSKEELSNYIDGFDVYNSLFLKKLNEPGLPRKKYTITTRVFRPDLIAKDFYGSSNFQSIVILQCGQMTNLKKGNSLNLIAKEYLTDIIDLL